MVRTRVAALIVRGNSVLLARHVKRARTTYLLPGGGIEPNESALDALTRELREEASATVRIGALRCVVEAIAPDGSKHLMQLVFDAALDGAVGPSTDSRVAACEWHDIAELETLDIHPAIGKQLAEEIRSGDTTCRYIIAPWVV
jgi:8-oxo-dGTP diphosphatase